MELLTGLFSAFGLSASAGLNAYIPLLIIALMGRFTNLITLSSPWDQLTSWWVIGVLLLLSVVEFFADKIPAVNHVNDLIQTIIRPVAGAITFAASANVITEINPVLSLIAGLFVAGSVHAVKAIAIRPAVTATTGGAGNVPVSILEDILSTIVSLISIIIPAIIALGAIAFAIWILLRQNRRSHRARLARRAKIL
jgi:Domain of unknown function (DUF4126)